MVAVGLAAYPYTRLYVTYYGDVQTAADLNALRVKTPRLARLHASKYIRGSETRTVGHRAARLVEVAVFPGTLGGGEVVISFTRRRGPRPDGSASHV